MSFRFSLENLNMPIKKPPRKPYRRQHINFKIEINKKSDINIFINFLVEDINKRLIIDKKHRFEYNRCHLKHLNFILMEIILLRVLQIFLFNFEINSSVSNNDENIKDAILYVPDKKYKKDLTIIKSEDLELKYYFMNDEEKIQEIANFIYIKYKNKSQFINISFLKKKIYEFMN